MGDTMSEENAFEHKLAAWKSPFTDDPPPTFEAGLPDSPRPGITEIPIEGFGRLRVKAYYHRDDRDAAGKELDWLVDALNRAVRQPPLTAEYVADLLNSALRHDPVATHALVVNRVPCNPKMVDHPSIVVDAMGGGYVVGLLGFLNGLVYGTGQVAQATFSADTDRAGQLIGFKAVPVPGSPPEPRSS
jgi:hypothetical protein